MRGCRMTAKGAKKSQQCHNYFHQYSTFASERLHASNLILVPGPILPHYAPDLH